MQNLERGAFYGAKIPINLDYGVGVQWDKLLIHYDPAKPMDAHCSKTLEETESLELIDTKDGENIDITMTLTSPFCPVAGSLPKEVAARAEEVGGVKKANVELVFEPPWSMDLMSDEAKLKLNLTENFSI